MSTHKDIVGDYGTSALEPVDNTDFVALVGDLTGKGSDSVVIFGPKSLLGMVGFPPKPVLSPEIYHHQEPCLLTIFTRPEHRRIQLCRWNRQKRQLGIPPS